MFANQELTAGFASILEACRAPFFSRVFHPDYNVDLDQAELEIHRFEQHLRVQRSEGTLARLTEHVQQLRSTQHGGLIIWNAVAAG